jgi:hypothetical protein
MIKSMISMTSSIIFPSVILFLLDAAAKKNSDSVTKLGRKGIAGYC